MKADFIKAALIGHFGYKGSIVCDEVSLPATAQWSHVLFADVFEIKKNNTVVIYEVKSSRADFNADKKWEKYLDYCELFYFVGDRETIEYIEARIPKNIGLYVVREDGHVGVKRRARRHTSLKLWTEELEDAILFKIRYRYIKHWYKQVKDRRKKQMKIAKGQTR